MMHLQEHAINLLFEKNIQVNNRIINVKHIKSIPSTRTQKSQCTHKTMRFPCIIAAYDYLLGDLKAFHPSSLYRVEVPLEELRALPLGVLGMPQKPACMHCVKSRANRCSRDTNLYRASVNTFE